MVTLRPKPLDHAPVRSVWSVDWGEAARVGTRGVVYELLGEGTGVCGQGEELGWLTGVRAGRNGKEVGGEGLATTVLQGR